MLPAELVFREGDAVPTRKATEAWFTWAMQRTAFFGSVLICFSFAPSAYRASIAAATVPRIHSDTVC